MSTRRNNPLLALDHVIGLALGLAFVVALMATMDIGFVRDEGFYFDASTSYAGWFVELFGNLRQWSLGDSFSQASVDRYFTVNGEHPALPKILFGLSHHVFHTELGWMSPGTAMRFPATLFAGALIYLVYLFGAEAFGRWQGVFAAVAMATMPRPFFHAHLTCFDYPVVTAWFAVSYFYWKSLASTRWAWVAGVGFGVALSIKHNIFFLPFVLVLHWLLIRASETHLEREADGGRLRLALPPIPTSFFLMATLGPVIWYALWPRHWFDTFNRVKWYLDFHLDHVHYFQYYFGELLTRPPFPVELPFVLSLLTMPEVVIVAASCGGALLLRQALRQRREGASTTGLGARLATLCGGALPHDARGTGWWLLLGAAIPFVIIAMPSTPVFGGIKHWMPAMPFIAIIASVAVAEAASAVLGLLGGVGRSAAARHGVAAALVLLLSAPAVTAVVHSHGNGTAFYNTFIGSARGAADARMMRQFWGYASEPALPFINEDAKPRARVYFQNTNKASYTMYKDMGMLRKDIVPSGLGGSDYAMFHHQMSFRTIELDIWRTYGTTSPVLVVDYEGVPVLSVYKRPKRRAEKR